MLTHVQTQIIFRSSLLHEEVIAFAHGFVTLRRVKFPPQRYQYTVYTVQLPKCRLPCFIYLPKWSGREKHVNRAGPTKGDLQNNVV